MKRAMLEWALSWTEWAEEWLRVQAMELREQLNNENWKRFGK